MKTKRTFWQTYGVIAIIALAGFAMGACDTTTPTYAGELIFARSGAGYAIIGSTAIGSVVVIPDSHNGLPVIHIGANAFRNSSLTSVTIPNSITSIGVEAFARSRLTSVNIPNSVTYVGAWAFRDNQLAIVNIPSSVTYIGRWAFARNQLTSIVIPNSVTYIGEGVFLGNSSISSVAIPFTTLAMADQMWGWQWRIGIPHDVSWIFIP